MGRFPLLDGTAAFTLAGQDSPDPESIDDLPDVAQTSLGQIIQLPPPEPIPDTSLGDNESRTYESGGSNLLPPTEMDHAKTKQILTNTELTQKERIEQLLTLAYRGGSILESSIPATLRAHIAKITENLADWYEGSEDYIETLIQERTAIPDIYDATDAYQNIPFLRNAADINDASWNHNQGEVGKRTELAARLIILEAIRAS